MQTNKKYGEAVVVAAPSPTISILYRSKSRYLCRAVDMTEKAKRNLKRKLMTPRSMRSEVWKHFGFEVDEDGVIIDKRNVWCRICEARVAYSGNTSNLASHIGKCQKANAIAGFSSTVKQPKQSKPTTPNSKKGQEATLALVKFIAKDMYPVDFVYGVGFREFISLLCPYFELPKREIIVSYIESIVEGKKRVIMQELNDVQYVSVTVDTWTSVTMDTYMEVNCHFIDSNWVLQTRPLEVEQLDQSPTSSEITAMLKKCEEKWFLQGRVVAYITANIGEAIEAIPGNNINCTAHFLQQIITNALNVQGVAELVDKARRIVCYLKQVNVIEVTVENSQEVQKISKIELALDLDEQWKSTYDMLRTLQERWKNVSSMLLDQELCLSDEEIGNLENICTLLEPVTEAATYLGGKKFASVAVVYPIFQSLLKALSVKMDDTVCISNFKMAMQESLKLRMEPINPLILHAAALHPQFKFLRFIPKEDHEDVWYEIKAELFTLYMVNACVASGENKEIVVMNEKPPLKKRGLLDDSDDEEEGEQRHCVEKEVIGYGEEKKSEIDAELWWRTNCIKYPYLAQLAKRYLSLVATSAPCYQMFGMEDNIISEKRKRLFGTNIKDVVFLHTYFNCSSDN